mmetsp:Transcript_82179/g.163761  ORF Transcript_82179/g.163761 Transcript_82179/m.163761 type:complete len:208 (-) Transcript_82179:1410-2033(-)
MTGKHPPSHQGTGRGREPVLQLIVDLEVIPKERRARAQLDGCATPCAAKLPHCTRSHLARVAFAKCKALPTAAMEVRQPRCAELLDLHDGRWLHGGDGIASCGEPADAQPFGDCLLDDSGGTLLASVLLLVLTPSMAYEERRRVGRGCLAARPTLLHSQLEERGGPVGPRAFGDRCVTHTHQAPLQLSEHGQHDGVGAGASVDRTDI